MGVPAGVVDGHRRPGDDLLCQQEIVVVEGDRGAMAHELHQAQGVPAGVQGHEENRVEAKRAQHSAVGLGRCHPRGHLGPRDVVQHGSSGGQCANRFRVVGVGVGLTDAEQGLRTAVEEERWASRRCVRASGELVPVSSRAESKRSTVTRSAKSSVQTCVNSSAVRVTSSVVPIRLLALLVRASRRCSRWSRSSW